MQIYVPSWDGGSYAGIRRRVRYLKRTRAKYAMACPVNLYPEDPADEPYDPEEPPHDGPYSPLDRFTVDPRFGGKETVLAVNSTLDEEGIVAIGDLVPHLHVDTDFWQRALEGDEEAREQIILFDDPEEAGYTRQRNVFGYDRAYRWVPELGKYTPQIFYPIQVHFDLGHPAVIEQTQRVAEWLLDELGYGALRGDAFGHAGGRVLMTERGFNEPDAKHLAQILVSRVLHPRGALLIPEADDQGAGDWSRICGAGYDFGWLPALVHSVDEGDWWPLLEEWARRSRYPHSQLRRLDTHDDFSGQFTPYWEPLKERHGGSEGEFVIFDHALKLKMRDLMPSNEAHVMAVGLTYLVPGAPLLFPGTLEGWRADTSQPERVGLRSAVNWDASLRWAGHAARPTFPLAPGWRTSGDSVAEQLGDPTSVLEQNLRWAELRESCPAFQYGGWVKLRSTNRALLAFARMTPDQGDAIVVANVKGDDHEDQRGYVRLSRWRGRGLAKMVTDPEAYRGVASLRSDPADVGRSPILWERGGELNWDNTLEFPVRLKSNELAVFIPY